MMYFRVLFFTNLTGVFWFASGFFLFLKGYNYLWSATSPLYFACLTVVCFVLGTMKSRYVLSKSMKRTVDRIKSPLPFYRIYGIRFYLLIGSMMALGICMNIFSLHPLIRGCVDLSIAFALMQGAFQYFKMGLSETKESYL